jgi:glycosyltransferase involved in cell wall biosynthesis
VSAPATPPVLAGRDGVSVILALQNERKRVATLVREIGATLLRGGYRAEVVVVDDGSTDATADAAREAGARVIVLAPRLGWAAAVRAGIEAAQHETVALFDPDGGFQPGDLVRLLSRAQDHEMVIGARPLERRDPAPWLRRAARGLLRRLAQSLVEREIPDLSSGLRVLKRGSFRRLAPLARGGGLTTALTIGMLAEGSAVAWVPVADGPPIGERRVRPFTNAFEVVHLLARTALLFNPLKAVAPAGYLILAAGLVLLGVDLARWGEVGRGALLLVVVGVQVVATAFLADLVGTVGRGR